MSLKRLIFRLLWISDLVSYLCCSKSYRTFDWGTNTIHLHVRLMIEAEDIVLKFFHIVGQYSFCSSELSRVPDILTPKEYVKTEILLNNLGQKTSKSPVAESLFARMDPLSTTWPSNGILLQNFCPGLHFNFWASVGIDRSYPVSLELEYLYLVSSVPYCANKINFLQHPFCGQMF